MIDRAEDDMYAYPPTHDNVGAIGVRWYFRDRSRFDVRVHRYDIPPGGSEGAHEHDPESDPLDELYIVISGRAAVRIGVETTTLEAGDAVLALAGTDHHVANAGSDMLRVLNIFGTPSGTAWPAARS